jgi:hypothetical protein
MAWKPVNYSMLFDANNMRTGLIGSSIVLSRALELAGGIATALLGLSIYLHVVIKDASLGAKFEFPIDVFVFLMLVAPAMFVALGSYLQAIRRKHWGAALMLIGGVPNLFFVGVNARLAFVLGGDIWGQRVVFADLVVVTFTLAAAFINVVVSVVFRNRL